MTKWEYKVEIHIIHPVNPQPKELVLFLNKYQEDGWEFIQQIYKTWYIFKRPILETKQDA